MNIPKITEQVLIVAAGVIVAGLIYHYASDSVPLLENSQDGFRFNIF